MKNTRFYELDLLRFLAAFAVLLFHYTFRGPVHAFTHITFPSLAAVAKYGSLGVELFFLISGFVILMTAMGKSFREFVVSRMARLYPAYWCCCTLTFLAALVCGQREFPVGAGQYLVNLSMVQGLLHVESIDGVYWSLLVELKFYALIAIVILTGQIPRIQHYLGAWLAAASLLSAFPVKALSTFLLPEHAGCFIGGAVLYLIAREGHSAYKLTLLAGSCLLAMVHALRAAEDYSAHYHVSLNAGVVGLMIAGFFLVFYLIATGQTQRLGSEKFVWLGTLTYPLYLLHQRIGYMLFNVLEGVVEKHLLLAGVTTLMLAASWWIHTNIERRYGPRLRAALERIIFPHQSAVAAPAPIPAE